MYYRENISFTRNVFMIRTREKRSIVWKLSNPEFQIMVKKSRSVGDICRKLSGRKGGSIFRNIQLRIQQLSLNTDHFIDGRVGRNSPHHISKEELLRRLDRNEEIDAKWLKQKLIEFSLIETKCSCGVSSIWNSKPLILHLDHIDGDSTNNRLSNLRILCPNCHTQTPTYSVGKYRKRKMVGDIGVEPNVSSVSD